MFQYKVDYWDEVEMARHEAEGLVGCDEWGEAIEAVRTYYGKGNVIGIYISEWSNIVETEDVIRGLTEKGDE